MSDIKKLGDDLRKALENLFAVTFEDLQSVYEETICEAILDEESSSGREYVGGKLIYEYIDDKNFTCEYILFFQDEHGKFFKKSAKTDKLSMKPLLTETYDELTAEKIIKFEIPEPSDDARAEYKRKCSRRR